MPKINDNIRLNVHELHKSFGQNHVLRGVNLSIKRGESLVIIGGSGSGKSILLRMILGLMQPDSGTISIDNTCTQNLPQRQRDKINQKTGMLFQNGALFDSLSVWENIAFVVRSQGANYQTARKNARAALARVELSPHILDLYPADLSAGVQKCVALARAIAHHPEIIFFDEPTTGLDPVMTDVINHLIRTCAKELGATTLTITHDMSSVRTIGDRLAFLYQGQMIWNGTVDKIETAENAHLHQFVNGLSDGPIEILGDV